MRTRTHHQRSFETSNVTARVSSRICDESGVHPGRRRTRYATAPGPPASHLASIVRSLRVRNGVPAAICMEGAENTLAQALLSDTPLARLVVLHRCGKRALHRLRKGEVRRAQHPDRHKGLHLRKRPGREGGVEII